MVHYLWCNYVRKLVAMVKLSEQGLCLVCWIGDMERKSANNGACVVQPAAMQILMPPLQEKWASIGDTDRDLLPLFECFTSLAQALCASHSALPHSFLSLRDGSWLCVCHCVTMCTIIQSVLVDLSSSAEKG